MPPPSERGCDLGVAFDRWFLRSCDRDAARRFASVGEQADALEVALATRATSPRRPSQAPEAMGHASTVDAGLEAADETDAAPPAPPAIREPSVERAAVESTTDPATAAELAQASSAAVATTHDEARPLEVPPAPRQRGRLLVVALAVASAAAALAVVLGRGPEPGAAGVPTGGASQSATTSGPPGSASASALAGAARSAASADGSAAWPAETAAASSAAPLVSSAPSGSDDISKPPPPPTSHTAAVPKPTAPAPVPSVAATVAPPPPATTTRDPLADPL